MSLFSTRRAPQSPWARAVGSARRASAVLVVLLVLLGVAISASAKAAPAGAGWTIGAEAIPSNFSASPSGGFPDGYTVIVRNAGASASHGSPVSIVDLLPAGITPVSVTGYRAAPNFAFPLGGGEEEEGTEEPLSCTMTTASVTCVEAASVPPGDYLFMAVTVSVSPSLAAGTTASGSVSVSGGGAPSASTSEQTPISSSPVGFGVESFTAEAVGANGLPDGQAGDHPFESTFSYDFNTSQRYDWKSARPIEDPKDMVVDLPAGFVGNPQVVTRCPQILAEEKGGNKCPRSSQVGVAELNILSATHQPLEGMTIAPIYNVTPSDGEPAQFMFDAGPVPVNLHVNVSPETNYGVQVTVSGIPRVASLTNVSLTFFGEPLTDSDVYNKGFGGQRLAFLQNPVDCSSGPLQARTFIDSWQNPGALLADGEPNPGDEAWKTFTTNMYPSISGCDALQFNPSVALLPETTRADEPTGATVDLDVPQSSDTIPALATPELRNATVTLPAGMSLSPSAADGLQACSSAQFAEGSTVSAACPDGSVLGTAKIVTPLLEGPLTGQVFLAAPECDPCTNADAADGRMVRLYLQAYGDGVRIKKEGRVYLNPSTGQLTAKFLENPELPFQTLELHFKGGLRAGLATPAVCGQASASTSLEPWSSPLTPIADPASSFDVDWDGAGGACPAGLPFAPSFSAGTSNPNAGQLSPFTLTFGREDREQDLSQIQLQMPPGLLGKLSGVPLCGEPQASLGTCGEGSRIGSMTVAAGPGSHPFYEQGEIYLTGPHDGAPFGLSIVVPTVAGPFNLGNVVVRAQIDVNQQTAALTVTSDPFPQIIDGIPLRLRTANVTIDRPDFIVNPTSCAQLHIPATIAGAQGAQGHVSAPFAVSGCAGLHFGPKFTVSTSGKTSRANGASLDAKVVFPAGAQSNIAKVKVDLPKQMPSRLTTLQKACTAAQFDANPAGCPAGSVIGLARANTPILPVPLTGPVYFVSHGGEAFPSLVVVLQGYGVRVDLTAATFISRKGITSSTFNAIPDVPVSSFELYLPEGPHSALAANGNLCTSSLEMPTSFVAQDGSQLKQDTKLTATGCPKAKTAAKKKKRTKATARKSNSNQSAGEDTGRNS